MIYKKIKEAKQNLLKMNSLEATQAGAEGTGIELGDKKDKEKKEGSGGSGGVDIGQIASVASKVLMKKSNPITFNASPFKETVSGDPNELVSYKGKKYTLEQLKKVKAGETNNPPELKAADGEYSAMTPGYKKFIDGLIGKGHTAQQLVDGKYLSQEGTGAFTFPGLSTSGGSETVSSNLTPVMETKTKPAEQNYNMSYASSVNANMSEGAQRRGTRRAERRANRDIRKYEEGSKGFLGLGKGKGKGELSANVIAAGNKTGKTIKGLDYDTDGKVTGDEDQKVTEQMASRAKSLSMNKYNQGLNENKYTPGSSTTSQADADGSERVVTDEDLKTKTTILGGNKSTVFNDFLKNKTFGGSLMTGFTKKGKLGKNATAFKYKSGRGAGY
jgi:hypothetical protein